MKISYTLERAKDGRRYWLCEHEDGTKEPLPVESPIAFFSSPRPKENVPSFPLGTKVLLEVPDCESNEGSSK